MMELLLGCGSNRAKKVHRPGEPNWTKLITLDINADHKPDLIWNLQNLPLPYEPNTFDEIHAYDVLEHLGQQGDYLRFFQEFEEWHRLLKPNGVLCGISPHWSSPWAWGDPGHTRIISPECLVFLIQPEYARQVGKTSMTDYRFCYSADFEIEFQHVDPTTRQFSYVLRAIKPARMVRSS